MHDVVTLLENVEFEYATIGKCVIVSQTARSQRNIFHSYIERMLNILNFLMILRYIKPKICSVLVIAYLYIKAIDEIITMKFIYEKKFASYRVARNA